MTVPTEHHAELQVIIAAEKPQKIEQIQRVLKQVFKGYSEANIDWHQATAIDGAIAEINRVLANLKDIKDTIEIVVVLTGFQGQWFEITGYLKMIEMANKKAGNDRIILKTLMVSANPMDIEQAQREGVQVINSMMDDATMAAYAAQILLGESSDYTLAQGNDGGEDGLGPAYEDFSQEQEKQPWDYKEFP